MVGPVIEQLADQYNGKALIARSMWTKESELAMRYQVMSIPTVILFPQRQGDRQGGGGPCPRTNTPRCWKPICKQSGLLRHRAGLSDMPSHTGTAPACRFRTFCANRGNPGAEGERGRKVLHFQMAHGRLKSAESGENRDGKRASAQAQTGITPRRSHWNGPLGFPGVRINLGVKEMPKELPKVYIPARWRIGFTI
jgi:hypothetical protein